MNRQYALVFTDKFCTRKLEVKRKTIFLSSIVETTKHLHELFSKEMSLATPLGLGKPNELLNEIYQSFKDKKKTLKIYTALSLEPPSFNDELARRLFDPIYERIWGKDYPVLEYSKAAKADQLPPHIRVHEFYFQAGSALKSESLQRDYQSVNYTHAAENVFRANVQVVVQLVAYQDTDTGRRYSFSCNPDMTLDVVDLYNSKGKEILIIGVLHPELPFIAGDAEVSEDFFYALLETPEIKAPLFALPRMPISTEDHLIGLYGSSLVEDDGTLQIGIGSLSESLVNALIWRHSENLEYLKLMDELNLSTVILNVFSKGLYGLTEMLTDGFMHLRKAGILIREVLDEGSGVKTYVHGSFFLGSAEFYQWLRDMPDTEKQGLRMTRVSKVNDIYDPNELILRKQRKKARFFNSTMQVTLLGDAMSETLPDGQVVSGVGGQYNFVAMSHELKGSRSILMLRSARRNSKGHRISNIVWTPGHITIPRHLRDMVITEYGIADLRGKTDEECIQELLNITDSEFQDELLQKAKSAHKISKNYKIPERFKNNSPQSIQKILGSKNRLAQFKPFPFGSDFTMEEQNLLLALQALKDEKKIYPLKLVCRLFSKAPPAEKFKSDLQRLNLFMPKTIKDRIYRKLVLSFLDSKIS